MLCVCRLFVARYIQHDPCSLSCGFADSGIPEHVSRIPIFRIYERLGLGVSISGKSAGSMHGESDMKVSGDQPCWFG